MFQPLPSADSLGLTGKLREAYERGLKPLPEGASALDAFRHRAAVVDSRFLASAIEGLQRRTERILQSAAR